MFINLKYIVIKRFFRFYIIISSIKYVCFVVIFVYCILYFKLVLFKLFRLLYLSFVKLFNNNKV